jgi:hypothetical protein
MLVIIKRKQNSSRLASTPLLYCPSHSHHHLFLIKWQQLCIFHQIMLSSTDRFNFFFNCNLQQKLHVEIWSKQHIEIRQLNQLTTIAKAGHMHLMLKCRVVALTDIYLHIYFRWIRMTEHGKLHSIDKLWMKNQTFNFDSLHMLFNILSPNHNFRLILILSCILVLNSFVNTWNLLQVLDLCNSYQDFT